MLPMLNLIVKFPGWGQWHYNVKLTQKYIILALLRQFCSVSVYSCSLLCVISPSLVLYFGYLYLS